MHYVCVLHSKSVDEFSLHSCVMMLTEHLEHLPPTQARDPGNLPYCCDFSGGVNWTTMTVQMEVMTGESRRLTCSSLVYCAPLWSPLWKYKTNQ